MSTAGTVTIADGCRLLVRGEARIALLGLMAQRLEDGARVRIIGTRADAREAGCGGAPAAIWVTRVTPLPPG